MYIRYRPIAKEDAEQVAQLTAQLGYDSTAAETMGRIDYLNSHPDHCTWVADKEGKIVGWIHAFYAVRLESAPFVEIGGLVVDEQHRGQGIGKNLIASTINWAHGKGVTTLRVRSNVKRKETHRFYEGFGFSETKEQKIFALRLDNTAR